MNAPEEPVLPLEEIQGIAIPGFFKPHQTLLYLQVPSDASLDGFKRFLLSLPVATGNETLADRRAARRAAASKGRPRAEHVVLVAVGFTYRGLLRLTPDAARMTSAAFKHGMVRRSVLLGDSTDPSAESHPAKWVVGGASTELDAMLVVAGDDREEVSARAAALSAELSELGIVVASEDGDVRADLPGHEHFGFDDGVSQPGIRGRASDAPSDYVTERHLGSSEIPSVWMYGYPGQELVWPGEFVIGLPSTGPDPLRAGLIEPCAPRWTQNGSFLVYRRLRQDVAAFWKTIRSEAARLARLPGFAGMEETRLAALLVGRWPSGAPVSRVPEGDDRTLGDDPLANNALLFDTDTPTWKHTRGIAASAPNASADPAGIRCPLAAHIRKVNPRDSATDVGGATSTQARRILRVGVPFGPPIPAAARYGDAPDPAAGNRGLLFLSIQ